MIAYANVMIMETDNDHHLKLRRNIAGNYHIFSVQDHDGFYLCYVNYYMLKHVASYRFKGPTVPQIH